MGVWGCTDTDEKDVEQWIPKLLREGWPAVRAGLVRVAESEERKLTFESAMIGIAAADVVAAARGEKDPDMPEEVVKWAELNQKSLDPKLVPVAKDVVGIVINFMADIWGEGDESFGCQTTANKLWRSLGGTDEPDEPDSPES
jgi:hypothetical protein